MGATAKEFWVSLHVAVDFGTSSTCTVTSVDGAEPQVVVIDGQPLLPSAVFAGTDGTLFVGHEAERHAAVDPSRFEPHPKRRIDEGSLLLGNSVLTVGDAVRAVLRRAVAEARHCAGGAVVDLLVLTHPAEWGNVRIQQLRTAARGLGKELALVPEPAAAAVFHSASHAMSDGGTLAVLDLGGGTVDASVVRREAAAFMVLATRGEPNFGGTDIDQLLLDHIGRIVAGADPRAWTQLNEGRNLPDRRRRRMLRQDVRGAKETLSRHTYTDVPIPPPFSDVHVTRTDLERLILEPLTGTAELVLDTLRDAAVPAGGLTGVFLVGGSSRIPLVSRLIHERTGLVPTTLDQPETVVARGALRAVRSEERVRDSMPTRRTAPGTARGGTVAPEDSLSRASTIVIGGNQETVVATPPRPRRLQPWRWLVLAGMLIVGVTAVLLLVTVK
jgi:molecular chaperone DnaK (HSP70)